MSMPRLVVVDRAAFLRRPDHRTLRVLALVGLVILWEAITRTGWVSPLFLPAPSAVLAEGYDMDYGRVVEVQKPEPFFAAPQSDRAKDFLSKILSH